MSRVHWTPIRAEDDLGSVWTEPGSDRLQRNVQLMLTPEMADQIRSGYRCLRCLEPQSTAFPEVCEGYEALGCSYPIRDRQVLDFSMESEGERLIGPQKPITQYLEDQEERAEKRRFIDKLRFRDKTVPEGLLKDAKLL